MTLARLERISRALVGLKAARKGWKSRLAHDSRSLSVDVGSCGPCKNAVSDVLCLRHERRFSTCGSSTLLKKEI